MSVARSSAAFAILNTNVPEDHKMMYGMPFPGDYLIAPDGTVRDKLFLPSYEHRPSASQVVLRNFGVDAGGNSIEIKADALTATVFYQPIDASPGRNWRYRWAYI